MIADMKRALGLVKFTASKRTVGPFLILYPLMGLMDFFLYKSLFIVPLLVGLLPVVLLQFIYASEMANYVVCGANRKRTIVNGTVGVMVVSSLITYFINVVMLGVELYFMKQGIITGDMVFLPQLTILMQATMLGVMLALSPFIYRKYILSMVIFIPACGLLGGVVGFINGLLASDKESIPFGEMQQAVLGTSGFGIAVVIGLVVIIIGCILFAINSAIMQKYAMDRLAFRQMFREKKSKF